MKMRKSLIQFATLATMGATVLAGCAGSGSGGSSASDKNEVKVWVQFSDETAEGKAWQEIVD
ncbi:ABC transporter substrate-binding protein, partial [Streptococcus pyogenes]